MSARLAPMSYLRQLGRDGQPRHVHGKDASSTRETARVDQAQVGFHGPSAESETKAEAGSIGAALFERTKEFVGIPRWKATAFILDFEEHSLWGGNNA